MPTLAACVAGLGLGAASLSAQVDQYGVKAAFIRNFVSFVEWPASSLPAGAPLGICVLSDSRVTPHLRSLNIPPPSGHAVQVRAVDRIPDLEGCSAAFVPWSNTGLVQEVRDRYAGRGVLTITEDDTKARTGAVINMFVGGNKVGFDVDLAAASTMDVRVSSKLITLARTVHKAALAEPSSGSVHGAGEERSHQ